MMQNLIRFIALISLVGCAVQSQPQGGARDEQPPVIVEQSPELGALNFRGHKAVIEFDEYIEAPKLRSEMKSTPELEELAFEIKGKRLELSWSKSQVLEANRTYRIDLGDAVQDLNERNPYKHLQLVWSTGSFIDSLRLDGQITIATGAVLEKLTVALLALPVDSTFKAAFKTSPVKEGTFSFSYLPVDTFHVIAFEDLNYNGSWDTTEPLGFSKYEVTRFDSVPFELPFVQTPFSAPVWNSTAVDSVSAMLDTLVESEVAEVSFEVPPHPTDLTVWLEHSTGWITKEVWPPTTDTLICAARTLLPGKYTLYGFVDANSDGSWNPPSFEDGRQAEEILVPQKFEFKAHWEVNQPVALPQAEKMTAEHEEN